MGQVTKNYTFASGQGVIAEQFNSNYDTIYNEFNGKIDNTNLKDGAGIVDTKLATITSANKVAISALVATNQVKGDIIYYTGSVWARLATGAAGTYLTMVSGLPTWSS